MGDACEFDTNGDGNCGRYTCARCYPQYQPLPKHAAAPTVRPAVACVAWPNAAGHTDCVGDTSYYSLDSVRETGLTAWPVTAIDGDARAIAARVREQVEAVMREWCMMGDMFSADQCEEIANAVTTRALGIPTEATTDG
jgi:hypothetical protein